jgi:hypothetical protein
VVVPIIHLFFLSKNKALKNELLYFAVEFYFKIFRLQVDKTCIKRTEKVATQSGDKKKSSNYYCCSDFVYLIKLTEMFAK